SVILVEHDISFLDYVSDSLHILHGESGAYGIVSAGLPSRTGINVLLDGYLPGENIRFRDSKISFNVFAPPDTETPFPRVSSYQDLVKSFKNFTLKVSAGEIKAGSVIGAIGGNALGKSTFMRILAGLEQPDNGKVELISSVSYKPQYLTANFDGDVQSLFYESFGERVEDPLFQSEVIHPLRINMLYDKKVKNLSGGELQKVAVATTLMRDADIYALDEPSAFIDVEERFVLARAIQRFVRSRGRSAIVIDHDIQLIDLVSDSLIIFTGKPAEEGFASRPVSKSTGMNLFLRDLGITYRRDVESGRPRVNKRESRLDKAQKDSGMYYYVATGAEQEQLRPAQ
ncbi:MAG: ATP-binding cassette domain-containing protein, partial [Thaumarchaeota archaeon]|nr:ATP-binding cassette domain-containing protein [Nitrososphaerota archaeon]